MSICNSGDGEHRGGRFSCVPVVLWKSDHPPAVFHAENLASIADLWYHYVARRCVGHRLRRLPDPRISRAVCVRKEAMPMGKMIIKTIIFLVILLAVLLLLTYFAPKAE